MLPHELCTHLRNGARAGLRRLCLHNTNQNFAILSILLRHGFITSLTLGTTREPSPQEFRAASVAQKRIWAEMKYKDNRPVLGDIQLVSKPSRKLYFDPDELKRLVSGQRAKMIKGLTLGEIVVVDTREAGFLEGREALGLGIGGEVVARVGTE
jgi:ribosomal protein S8